jgi:hypothetical protein
VGIYIYMFLLISSVTLYSTRFNFLHPAFLFSVTIALYGFLGIYFAAQSTFIARFGEDTIYVGFFYGFAAYLAFLAGCALFSLSENSSVLQRDQLIERQSFNSLSFLSIPWELKICLILISIGGAIALMLVSEGSVYKFVDNLNMRQISSVGSNWLMFFVLACRLPIHDSIGKKVIEKKRLAFSFILYTAPLIAIIALVAGRQFVLLIILQIYIVYSKYKPISISTKVGSLFLGLLIYFVYGFARYFQGVEGGSQAIDILVFLSGEDEKQNFMAVMQTIMFDGWYILLSVIDATEYSVRHGNGAVLLSSFTKVIPGFHESVLSVLYPDYANIVEQYDLQYRAISWNSEAWMDFGWYGIGLDVIFGYIVMRLYKCINSHGIGFWATIVWSSLYLYLFLMIRNGFGWAVAYISIEMLWIFVVLGFINLPPVFNYGAPRKMGSHFVRSRGVDAGEPPPE